MKLHLIPDGWPVALADCPPGVFVWRDEVHKFHLGFKTEYRRKDGRMEVYNEAGEAFCITPEVWPCEMREEMDT